MGIGQGVLSAMKIVSIDEIQKMGGSLLPDGRLSYKDNIFVKGGTFPESSKDFVKSIEQKYLKSGVECLLVNSSGMITIWRNEKKVDNQSRAELKSYKPTIVHIDDSPNEGKIMGAILGELNCNFTQVNNAMLAVANILKIRPDLIFLDLNMPIVNGYEICAQLRRVDMFKATPIIIVTANDGLVDRVRAKMSGATDFISKPLDRDKIVSIFEKYLSKNS